GPYPSYTCSSYPLASLSDALLMAASMRSFGILTAFPFWMAVRRREFPSGFGPPSLTAIAISFPKRVNCTAILAQRLNFRSFLNSKALPIVYVIYTFFYGLQPRFSTPGPTSGPMITQSCIECKLSKISIAITAWQPIQSFCDTLYVRRKHCKPQPPQCTPQREAVCLHQTGRPRKTPLGWRCSDCAPAV